MKRAGVAYGREQKGEAGIKTESFEWFSWKPSR